MKFATPASPSCRSLLHALVRLCRPPLQRGSRQTQADYYVKSYPSSAFALALISHFVLGLRSLRQLKTQLDCDARLRRAVGLGGISEAQLPKLLHRRPPALWEPLVAALLARLPQHRLPTRVRVMDSSFFHLGMKLLARQLARRFTPESAGVKLTLIMEPATGAPQAWSVTMGQGNDIPAGVALCAAQEEIHGHLYIFDRGYRKYAFFGTLMERGADFLTRGELDGSYVVLATRPLPEEPGEILSDQIVQVGSRAARNLLERPVRRIVKHTAQGEVIFLTSLFDLPAGEVAELYRTRWQIEILFRWLKRALACTKPLGYSPEAAAHTFYAALVCYLLMLLVAQAAGTPRRLAKTVYEIRAGLHERPELRHLQAFGFL
jgi:hypothetical protein